MNSILFHKGLHRGILNGLMLVVLVAVFMTGSLPAAHAAEGFPFNNPPPKLSADGLTLENGVAPLVVMADPDPAAQNIHLPDAPEVKAALADPSSAASTFTITFKAAGTSDPWGEACYAWPAAAKTAFQAAAAVWSGTLKSSVPITISACWANLGSTTTLGYSGGASSYRNFTGAPKPNVWYESSLANALHGSDLDASKFDDYITYNSHFTWYYGTDGNVPAGQYDLVSVAAHEIGHGLNFSGTANYSGGTGSYGGGTGYPNIYDYFVENAAGTKMTALPNNSATLGSLFTGGNLWWNAPLSRAANGGTRVRLFAPSTWMPGSSYAHLDYNTFRTTTSALMVYAIGSGTARHSAGPITIAMMKDMGWPTATSGGTVPTPVTPSGSTTDKTPTYKWTKVTGATYYSYQLYKGTTLVYTKTLTSAGAACGATYCTNTPATTLTLGSYKWHVRAKVGGVWKAYSTYKTFSITAPATGPTPGYYDSGMGEDFYVTPTRNNVDDFSVYLYACSANWKVTHTVLVPIVSNHFAFTGSFYASGTFTTSTRANGTDGFTSFLLPGCGYVTDSWSYIANWVNSTQPTAMRVQVAPNWVQQLGLSTANLPSAYHVVKLVK